MKSCLHRGRGQERQSLKRVTLGCLAVFPLFFSIQAFSGSQDGEIRILSLNTWNDRFFQDPSLLSDFLVNGNYDVLTFQEIRGGGPYIEVFPGLLEEAGLGEYTASRVEDLGIISRLHGEHDHFVGDGTVGYISLEANGGAPDMAVGTVHLNYFDDDSTRVQEVRSINEWKRGIDQPIILTGDFNAGDVAERGLHSVDQQKNVVD